MKNIKKIAALFTLGIALVMAACNDAPPVIKDASILPIPVSLKQDTTCFVLPKSTTIGINDPQLRPAAEYLVGILKPATGYSFKVSEGEGDINLSVGEVKGVEDSYTLTANPEGVTITGNTYRGVVAGRSCGSLMPMVVLLGSTKQVVSCFRLTGIGRMDASLITGGASLQAAITRAMPRVKRAAIFFSFFIFIVFKIFILSFKTFCHSEERSDEESWKHPRVCYRDPSLRSG